MIPRYAYHKPFTVKLPDKHEWQNWFKTNIEGDLVWYKDELKTNKCTGARIYGWGLIIGHSFSLGLHVIQVEVYTSKACVMENTE